MYVSCSWFAVNEKIRHSFFLFLLLRRRSFAFLSVCLSILLSLLRALFSGFYYYPTHTHTIVDIINFIRVSLSLVVYVFFTTTNSSNRYPNFDIFQENVCTLLLFLRLLFFIFFSSSSSSCVCVTNFLFLFYPIERNILLLLLLRQTYTNRECPIAMYRIKPIHNSSIIDI